MLRRTLMDRVHGPLAGRICLRPAVAADEPLLYRIYASARGEELQLFDWDPARKRPSSKCSSSPRRILPPAFPDSGYELILLTTNRLGVSSPPRSRRDPPCRYRAASGTSQPGHRCVFIAAILDEAAEAGKPVRLHVESPTVPNGFTSGSAFCRSLFVVCTSKWSLCRIDRRAGLNPEDRRHDARNHARRRQCLWTSVHFFVDERPGHVHHTTLFQGGLGGPGYWHVRAHRQNPLMHHFRAPGSVSHRVPWPNRFLTGTRREPAHGP